MLKIFDKLLCLFQDHEFEEMETFFHKEGTELHTITMHKCKNCGIKKKVTVIKEETEEEVIKKEQTDFEY